MQEYIYIYRYILIYIYIYEYISLPIYHQVITSVRFNHRTNWKSCRSLSPFAAALGGCSLAALLLLRAALLAIKLPNVGSYLHIYVFLSFVLIYLNISYLCWILCSQLPLRFKGCFCIHLDLRLSIAAAVAEEDVTVVEKVFESVKGPWEKNSDMVFTFVCSNRF